MLSISTYLTHHSKIHKKIFKISPTFKGEKVKGKKAMVSVVKNA